jgi:hypothetical protein
MFGIDTLQVRLVQLQYSTVLCCWLAGWGLSCCLLELVPLPGDADILCCRISRAQGAPAVEALYAILVSSE